MKKSLLLFLCSPTIDTYINSMTHAIDKHGIDHIVLVNLREIPSGKQIEFEEFKGELEKVILGLTKNIYFFKDKDGKWQQENVQIPNKFLGYELLRKVFCNSLDLRSVGYDFLRKNLKQLISEYENKGDFIIDLSGIPKRASIDVFMACSTIGVEKIVTFELKKKPEKFNTLYNNLETKDYEYVVLPDGESFIKSVEFLVAKKNSTKFFMVMSAIVISAIVVPLHIILKGKLGDSHWFVYGLLAFFTILSGIIPILDAWGAFNFYHFKSQVRSKLSSDRQTTRSFNQ